MPPHPLTNLKMQRYYQNEPRFKDVYSRDNLRKTQFHSKTKDGKYVINHDEYTNICIHWIAFYVNGNAVTYFDSFGVEHIPKKIEKFIGSKRSSIAINIFTIQAYDSVICEYFCNEFINLRVKG